MDRIINFPEINWDKLREGAISKEMVWEELEKGIKFVLEVQMLKKTSFLSKDTIEQSQDVLEKMRELKEKFPQVHGVIQNILGRQIKEMAIRSGDSRTLFSRLEFLVEEAVFYGSLAEWKEADLERVPYGLKKDFEVRLYDPRTKQTRHFLPASWRNDTHKRTALVLHDLSFKARDTYKAERGQSQKLETPLAPPVETKIKDFVPPAKNETPAKTQKPKPMTKKSQQDGEPKSGKKAKVAKDKDREKQDKKELQSVKSFADVGKLVQ